MKPISRKRFARIAYGKRVVNGEIVTQMEQFRRSRCVILSGSIEEFHLLDSGVCASALSPLDGRAVNCSSGCPTFGSIKFERNAGASIAAHLCHSRDRADSNALTIRGALCRCVETDSSSESGENCFALVD